MAYSIIYHAEIRKDIAGLPKNIKSRIRKSIENRLLIDPIKYGQPLRHGLQGYRKSRVGDYKIIYKIDKNNIVILKIGHRKDVYGKPRYN